MPYTCKDFVPVKAMSFVLGHIRGRPMTSLETLTDGIAMVTRSWSDLSAVGTEILDANIQVLGYKQIYSAAVMLVTAVRSMQYPRQQKLRLQL